MEFIKGNTLDECKYKFQYRNRWFERSYYGYCKSPYEAMQKLFGLKDMEFLDTEIKELLEKHQNDSDELTKAYLDLIQIKTREIETTDEYDANRMMTILNQMIAATNELEVVKAFHNFIVTISEYRRFLFGNKLSSTKDGTLATEQHNEFCSLYWGKVRELKLKLN